MDTISTGNGHRIRLPFTYSMIMASLSPFVYAPHLYYSASLCVPYCTNSSPAVYSLTLVYRVGLNMEMGLNRPLFSVE